MKVLQRNTVPKTEAIHRISSSFRIIKIQGPLTRECSAMMHLHLIAVCRSGKLRRNPATGSSKRSVIKSAIISYKERAPRRKISWTMRLPLLNAQRKRCPMIKILRLLHITTWRLRSYFCQKRLPIHKQPKQRGMRQSGM